MFQILDRFSKRRAMRDLEYAMLQAYQYLDKAKANPDALIQRAETVTAMAALFGGIRDAYPAYPLENNSLGMAIIEANADARYDDLQYLLDKLFSLMDRCPSTNAARDQAMTFIVAPTYHDKLIGRAKEK